MGRNARTAVDAITESLGRLDGRTAGAIQTEVTRTTLSAPRQAIVELRMLALRRNCTLNDLLLIAISDLLNTAGIACPVQVNERVRRTLKGKGEEAGPPPRA
jgi:hypothetical protein